MDNIAEFLELQADLLEIEGYEVLKAHTVTEAREYLNKRRIHLALMDIRMENEDEKEDNSGLQLARDPQFHHIPKIILTAHRDTTSVEGLIEALSPVPGGPAPVLTVVGKTQPTEYLSRMIKQILKDHVPINWDLCVRWQNPYSISFEQLVFSLCKIVPDGQLLDTVGHLQDVFASLFLEADKLTVGEVLQWRDGQCALKVFAYDEGGVEGQFIVSVGRKEAISSELKRYEAFAPRQPQSGHTSLVNHVVKGVFGGISFKLVGGDMVNVASWKNYFHRFDWQMMVHGFRFLFERSLRRQGRMKELRDGQLFVQESLAWLDLDGLSGVLAEKIEHLCWVVQRLDQSDLPQLKTEGERLVLKMPAIPITYLPNPAQAITDESLPAPKNVRYGVVHGNVWTDTVLTNEKSQMWLIDFHNAGISPLVWDYASLETALKFELFTTTNLLQRFSLEQALLTPVSLGDALPIDETTLSTEQIKIIKSIQAIRQLANEPVGGDPIAYWITLLFSALKFITFYQIDGYYSVK
jgi:CheY-like chemotaxis protein